MYSTYRLYGNNFMFIGHYLVEPQTPTPEFPFYRVFIGQNKLIQH